MISGTAFVDLSAAYDTVNHRLLIQKLFNITLLSEYLFSLFTCMLSHCFIRTSFSVSTMVHIPKGSNKDLTNIKNYRGIALSSLISKLFDNCIISSTLYIFESDNLQFAYKKKTSTIQCVSIIKEVINYYVNQNSCVYMCMLDASKSI